MERLCWNEYFKNIALAVSSRSPDPSRKVGAVLVNLDNRLISTGYNGLVAGSDDKIDWTNRKLVQSLVIHAETNCIIYSGIKFKDPLKMYITTSPCRECLKLIASINVIEIFYINEYPDIEIVKEICSFYNIKLIKL
jgi:dCMP deaminase